MGAKGRQQAVGRQYTAAEKGAVAADLASLGLRGAARRHGVPESTIRGWLRRGEASTGLAVAGVPGEAVAPSRGTETPTGPAPSSDRVARLYPPSEKARILEHAAAHGVTATAKHSGVSRFSVYDWRRKDAKVSVYTVREVMVEAGYRPPKVRRHEHTERFEATRPNHLRHLDFVHRHINRTSTFTLILLDDYSRFVVGQGVDETARADLVTETFEEAVTRHGKPEMVLHDEGSAFWSWRGISRFTALLTELGIDQITAEHKEWNGRLEVFNANLHKELFDVVRFWDLAEMRRRLAAHLHWCNHARTHHALGGLLVPADRYCGRTGEVMARMESGEGRHVRHHLRIPWGLDVLKDILDAIGVRTPKRRPGRYPDEKALRR